MGRKGGEAKRDSFAAVHFVADCAFEAESEADCSVCVCVYVCMCVCVCVCVYV